MPSNVKAFKPIFHNALKAIDPGAIAGFKNQYPASEDKYSDKLKAIHGVLYEYASVRGVNMSNSRLAVRTSPFDYYLPKFKYVVELDERQHFSQARFVSLASYPKNARLGFDRDRWMHLCLSIKARDSHPLWRDEQRAWLDTLRDLAWQDKKFLPTSTITGIVRIYEQDVLCFFENPKKLVNFIKKYLRRFNMV
jgi:hypothetical protein